jgi:signal transduction histidine kinase
MLRAQTDTRTLPFIFLTAKTERSEMRKGMGLGASDFLTKPFENDELIDAVRARLSQHDSFEQVAQAQLIQLRESIITALPHELRTPLNTIIGFSDMLNAEADNVSVDEVREWSGHIQSAAHRLNRLIENYLTYVRIQALLRDPERLARHRAQVTAFPHITTEHQAIFVAQRYDRTADLLIEHGEQAQVCCAESDLTKMVDELLDNAFKFSKPGVGVKLTTQLLEHNGRWCYEMSVTDYGRGLRPEQIKTIGAYMQFDRLIYEQQGAGMGLAVAKGLCEMYLGHMHISSTVGVFTTVTVHLPVVM